MTKEDKELLLKDLSARLLYKIKEEKQGEQKLVNTDYISGIRKELLSIEDNAKNINGLTESQWVAIRAAHRLLGEYIAKEQKPAWSEEDEERLDNAITQLKAASNIIVNDEVDYSIAFIKSLKERIQLKVEHKFTNK